LKSSYVSQVTTPPGRRLQHHFMILHRTCISWLACYPGKEEQGHTIGSMSISSLCTSRDLFCHVPSYCILKKFLMKLLEPTGSGPGRNGRRRKGISRAMTS
jgi:hypothetical protein